MGDDEITRFMKHTVVKKVLLERTRKFQDALLVTQAVWDSVLGVVGMDTPKALEPKRKRTPLGQSERELQAIDVVRLRLTPFIVYPKS